MDTSSFTSCEWLCRLRGETGCCYLTDGLEGTVSKGCYWKADSVASIGEDDSRAAEMAITCTKRGKLKQYF